MLAYFSSEVVKKKSILLINWMQVEREIDQGCVQKFLASATDQKQLPLMKRERLVKKDV